MRPCRKSPAGGVGQHHRRAGAACAVFNARRIRDPSLPGSRLRDSRGARNSDVPCVSWQAISIGPAQSVREGAGGRPRDFPQLRLDAQSPAADGSVPAAGLRSGATEPQPQRPEPRPSTSAGASDFESPEPQWEKEGLGLQQHFRSAGIARHATPPKIHAGRPVDGARGLGTRSPGSWTPVVWCANRRPSAAVPSTCPRSAASITREGLPHEEDRPQTRT